MSTLMTGSLEWETAAVHQVLTVPSPLPEFISMIPLMTVRGLGRFWMPTVDVTPVLLDCKVHDLLSCHAALLSQLLLCSAPLTYGSYGFNRWTMEIDSTQYLRTLGKKYKIGLDCIKWWKIAGHRKVFKARLCASWWARYRLARMLRIQPQINE